MKFFGPAPWIHTRTATTNAPVLLVEPPSSPPPLVTPEPPRERKLYVIFASVAVVAIIVGLWAWHVRETRRAETAGGATITTAKVERRTFVRTLRLSGTLEAVRSYSLLAPRLTGGDFGNMILTKLTPGGTRVKKGDLLAEFDREAQLKTFMDKQAEYRDLVNQIESKQAEAEIEQTRAQARLQEEQDLTDLEKARYDVQCAKLEVSKAENLSKLEGEKNKLLLADAEQHLKEEEEKLVSGRAKAAADIDGKKQKREKSLRDVQVTEQDIALLTLRAPQDGMVTIRPNWRASRWSSDSAPPFKEGDRAWQGARIAEFPDISTLRVNGRVDEADRGRVKEGQPATGREAKEQLEASVTAGLKPRPSSMGSSRDRTEKNALGASAGGPGGGRRRAGACPAAVAQTSARHPHGGGEARASGHEGVHSR
jgi:multidrug efflux pump subunit AcrA (membrane-fusion protein)